MFCFRIPFRCEQFRCLHACMPRILESAFCIFFAVTEMLCSSALNVWISSFACAGDAMQVIRDALLSQLQKDRLRQEIIVAELAKIERAMAMRSAGYHHGAASSSANPGRANPAGHFTLDQQFVTHGRGAVSPERRVGVDEVRDLKKEDGVHGGVRIKSEKPDMEDDLLRECSKTSAGNCNVAGQENAASDGCKQEPSEVSS